MTDFNKEMTNETEIKKHLDTLIAAEKEIVKNSNITKSEAKDLAAEFVKLFDACSNGEVEKPEQSVIDGLMEGLRVSNSYDSIDRFNASLNSDLFIGSTKYVIVNSGVRVISPAGFAPCQNVWGFSECPEVFIQTDRLPGSLSGLTVYDLDEMRSK
jgi:polyhydroxyalkanoate synthesis regulator phasin